MYSSKLYIGSATSKSSALSINTLLVFEIQLINGALFLDATLLFIQFFALSGFVTVTTRLTKIYASE